MTKKKPTLQSLISMWHINKVYLASKMDIPAGTFNNKLSTTQTAYKFTEDKENKLKNILLEMSSDIQEVAGITFNEALKQIGRKKV
jgi:hypothetical protein